MFSRVVAIGYWGSEAVAILIRAKGLNKRLQNLEYLGLIAAFALNYLLLAMAATFGDVKVINGEGKNRQADPLSNCVYDKFIATEGEAVSQMQ